MRHSRNHEELLAASLGERDPRAAFQASEAATCEECRSLMDDLLHAREGLDELGRDLRASLPRTAGPVVGTHLVGQVLGPRLAARVRARRMGWAAALLAAAAVVFLAWPRPRPDVGREPGPLLGGAPLELLEPRGNVARFGPFRWKAALPPGGWFEVVVRAVDESAESVLARTRVEGNDWNPESTADWPDEILWQVDLYDASGAARGGQEARASRSSR